MWEFGQKRYGFLYCGGLLYKLKVQPCKLYNNKYMIASKHITNIELFPLTAYFWSYWVVKLFFLKTEKTIEAVKK